MAVSLRLFGLAALAALFCASQAADPGPDAAEAERHDASGRRVLMRTAKPDGTVDVGPDDMVDTDNAGVVVTPSGEAVLDFAYERDHPDHQHHHRHKHDQQHHDHPDHEHHHGGKHEGKDTKDGKDHHDGEHGDNASGGHHGGEQSHRPHDKLSWVGGDDRSSEGQHHRKDSPRGGEEAGEEDSHDSGSFVEVDDVDDSEGSRASFHADQSAKNRVGAIQAASDGRDWEEDDDTADSDADADDDISEGDDGNDDENDLALEDTANADEKEKGHEKHHGHGHHGDSTMAGLDATLEREVRDAFAIYDKDKNGFLDKKELNTLVKHTGISRELPGGDSAVRSLWDAYDEDKDGKLSVGEVLKMAKDHEDEEDSVDDENSLLEEGGDEGEADGNDFSSLTQEYVKEQFKKHDKDKSGFLEGPEMIALLKENGADDDVEWEDVDPDGDKRMSFEELTRLAAESDELPS